MKAWFLRFFVVLVVCLLLPTKIFAAGEFQADYDVQYAIAPTGTTIVTQNVTLTNQVSNLYPQKYSIVIDSLKIKNVIAFDNIGIVTPEISQKDGKTEIILPFNDKVVGLGKQLQFSLRYENGDIAQKNGNIWEVNVPGITNDPDLATYIVSLRVPPTFGPNAYMTPLPAAGNRWIKEQMIKGGISAAYGDQQLFALSLSYYIENPQVTSRLTEIALPPDTAFQKVKLETLDPRPKTILRDDDGNWLAQYELLPMQRLAITAKVTIAVSMRAPDGFTQPLTDKEAYLKPLKYWESKNKEIADLARTHKTPREIYDYVSQTLSYDYKRVGQTPIRKGALQALTTPANSICMEFTDLFIAIARAAGIPARESIGYAHTTNAKLRPLSLGTDVLHAWPEYYDSQRQIWIPVDPTWANTTGGVNYFDKLDFNHIVFAVQGRQSDYPYPAGFYKKQGSTGKDIDVKFATTPPTFTPGKLITSYQFPTSVTSGFPASGRVIVENTGGVAWPKIEVTVQSAPSDVALHKVFTEVPPLAKLSLPVSVALPSYFTKGKGLVATTVNDEVATHYFDIQPLAYRYILPIFIASLFILLVAWLTIKQPWIKKHHSK